MAEKEKSTKVSSEQPQKTKVSRVDVLEDESSQDYNDGDESVDMREIIEDIPTEQEGNPRKRKLSSTEQQQTNVKTSRNEGLEDDSHDNCLDMKDHTEVYQECEHCSADWELIGINLGVSATTIAIINRDYPNSSKLCMLHMLAKWLQRENDRCVPNWRTLCQALCAFNKSTADEIAKKHHVTDYMNMKDLRSDKEKAVAAAKHLKNEFLKLLTVAYFVVSTADVGLFKVCVTWLLASARLTTPQVQQHLVELNAIPTSLGILIYLVSNNFIGYLNYKLLKEFQTVAAKSEELKKLVEPVGSKELKIDIEEYDRKHDEFIHSVSFNTIIEVFKQYPDLAPASHIGLPDFKIHLEAPWNNKHVYEWTEFFELRFSWPSFLIITKVSVNSIILTYAVLPIFVSSVIRDLTNPEVLRELKGNGVKVQLSKVLLEINEDMSKPAKNKLDFPEKTEKCCVLSKKLSSSEGNVHVLGLQEHDSLMNTVSAVEGQIDGDKESAVHILKIPDKLSVIEILNLEVTNTQLISLLSAFPLSDKQQSQSLAVKETTEISLSETVLPIGMEEKCSDQYEFQHEKLCSPQQDSDPITQAVKSTNICEIVHFFRLHDLQVTAQQKIKILSLVSRLDTEDFQFPFEKNPLKVLLSIIHDTESIIQKAVDEKEAELTKELKELNERAGLYQKMTVRMSQELDEKKKEESKTLQRMEEAGEGDDKTLHSKEDMDMELEAKIEQEGEKAGMHLHVEDSPDKPHVDTEEVIQCIKQVFKKFLPALSGLIEGLLQTVVSEMLAVGLIPRAVEKNPSSDAILSFFLSGLDFKDELEEIEEYCVLFFSVFHEISGQFADAGAKINKTIQKMVRDKLGVRFNIDLGFHKRVLKVHGELEDSKEEELHPDTAVHSSLQVNRYYTGQILHTYQATNMWTFKFRISKLDSIQMKHWKDKDNSIEEQIVIFEFKDPVNGYIELDLERERSFKGWTITPHMLPLRLYKRDADLFESGELSDPPSCLITVFGKTAHDTELLLNYRIGLIGTISDINMLSINRALDTYFLRETTSHHIIQPVDETSYDTEEEDDESKDKETKDEREEEYSGLIGKHEDVTQQNKERMYPLKMCKFYTMEQARKGKHNCVNCYKEDYPQILVLNPFHEVSTHFKHTLEVKRRLSAQTKKLSRKYQECSASTWSALKDRDNYNLKDDRISIADVKIELETLGISVHGYNVMKTYDEDRSAISPGWWKIEPIHHLAKRFLSDTSPRVISEWNNYIDMFKTYISERNRKDYAPVLFNTSSDNIFILETDECYDEFYLRHISMLRETLSYIFDLPELSLHLVCVRIE